jgi:hypothetical protein
MRKRAASTCNRRPSLDLLEDRHLLSGGIEVIGVYSAPAIVVAIDLREPIHAPGLVEFPSPPPFSQNTPFPFPQMPVDWFHHDPGRWGHAFPLAPEFQSTLSAPEPQETSAPLLISGSMAVYAALPFQGGVSPSLAPPPMPGLPGASLFLPGDVQRLKVDLEFLREHGPQAKPLPEASAINLEGNTEDVQGVSIAALYGTPSTGPVLVGSSNAQVAPSAALAPIPLTTLINPEAGRIDQIAFSTRMSEALVNQRMESGHGFAKIVSANLVTTVTSTTVTTAVHPDGNVPAPEPLGHGNQEEIPLPHAADLIADVLPLDRASLERAVDQFFDRLEDLGVGQLLEPGPTRAIPLSLALIGTVTAVEIARRRLRLKTVERLPGRRLDPLGSEELCGFPELPGSWSTRLT